MAYLTSLGWLIALPIAGGVLLGRFLDEWLGSGFFWTLALLGAGIALAGLGLYFAIRIELRRREHG